MTKRILGMMMAGSIVMVAGCMGLPNGGGLPGGSTLSSGVGTLDLGLSGSSYTVAGFNVANTHGETGSGGTGQPAALDFTEVMFRPELVEVHFSGALKDEEKAAAPKDIKGQDAAQTQPDPAVASEDASGSQIPADGWIKFPMKADLAAFDLMKLEGGSPVSFGEGGLPEGKYDQIRLTARNDESKALLTYKTSDAKSGNYFLPSGRLYITQGFEVRKGYETDLKFGFDVKSAMVDAGGQMIILKPGSVRVNAKYIKIEEATSSAQ